MAIQEMIGAMRRKGGRCMPLHRMPHKCPVCDGKLTVTRVSCPTCGTTMEGEFTGCRFCELSPEESRFLLAFIRNRGSIKDVERELGVSYPTVRAALDGLIASLGLNQPPAQVLPQGEGSGAHTAEPSGGDPDPTDRAAARRDILDMLAKHRITAAEAASRLQKL